MRSREHRHLSQTASQWIVIIRTVGAKRLNGDQQLSHLPENPGRWVNRLLDCSIRAAATIPGRKPRRVSLEPKRSLTRSRIAPLSFRVNRIERSQAVQWRQVLAVRQVGGGGGKQTTEVAGRAKPSRDGTPKQAISISLDTRGERVYSLCQGKAQYRKFRKRGKNGDFRTTTTHSFCFVAAGSAVPRTAARSVSWPAGWGGFPFAATRPKKVLTIGGDVDYMLAILGTGATLW